MGHRQGTFTGEGNLTLFYQIWSPLDPPRAKLIIVHGLGSYADTFMPLVSYMLDRGYAIYSFDLRGHGRSGGKRGYINRWSEFRADLRGFVHMVAADAPHLPCFIYGHSLGATITLDYAIRFPHELRGIILSALPIGKVGLAPMKLALGQIFSAIWPSFALNTGLDVAAGSRDPAVVDTLRQDPLRHTSGRARLSTEFFATLAWVRAHIADLQVPVLMLHGSADRTVPCGPSYDYFQKIMGNNKRYIEYPEAYHNLHQDLNASVVFADVEHWLEQQILCHAANSV